MNRAERAAFETGRANPFMRPVKARQFHLYNQGVTLLASIHAEIEPQIAARQREHEIWDSIGSMSMGFTVKE